MYARDGTSGAFMTIAEYNGCDQRASNGVGRRGKLGGARFKNGIGECFLTSKSFCSIFKLFVFFASRSCSADGLVESLTTSEILSSRVSGGCVHLLFSKSALLTPNEVTTDGPPETCSGVALRFDDPARTNSTRSFSENPMILSEQCDELNMMGSQICHKRKYLALQNLYTLVSVAH